MGIVQDYSKRLEEARSALAAGIEEGLEVLVNSEHPHFTLSRSDELYAQISEGKLFALGPSYLGPILWRLVTIDALKLRQKELPYLLDLAGRLDDELLTYVIESGMQAK
ncbi:MAG: hypothetical protein HYU02_08620 [Thaumarchaeota archaeon]|nr:hypothetical protein [Nitrososphaerota archaeon]